MAPRTFTEEEKSEALLLYVDLGPAEAARRTGISPLTISSWAKRSGLHTNALVKTKEATEQLKVRAAEMREELKVRMLAKALDLVDRMDAPHVEFKGKEAMQVTYPVAPAGAVQNYATSIGILIDKFRLESGEVTGRTETQSITGGLNDDERARLRDAIDRYYDRGRAGRVVDGRAADGSPTGDRAEVRQ